MGSWSAELRLKPCLSDTLAAAKTKSAPMMNQAGHNSAKKFTNFDGGKGCLSLRRPSSKLWSLSRKQKLQPLSRARASGRTSWIDFSGDTESQVL